MRLELIYIGDGQSRFTKGEKYKAISFTEYTTTLLDRDNVPFDISNDVLHHYFRSIQSWREEQLNKILYEI